LITKEIIHRNDPYFDLFVPFKLISDIGAGFIKYIDKAEILDLSTGAIKTPFGIASFLNLSTGCKTALNILHAADNKLDCAVNVTGCGWNALNCIFGYLDAHGNCVDILLEHVDISKCDDFEFMVNKTDYCKNITELMSFILKKVAFK
jgi:hypothetical protein